MVGRKKFFVYDIRIYDNDIYLWSLTEKSKNILVTLTGYNETIYVMPKCDNDEFFDILRKYFRNSNNIVEIGVVSKKSLYGYNNEVKLYSVTGSISLIKKFYMYFTYRVKNKIMFFDTMIDGVRKFLTNIDGKYAGWYEADLEKEIMSKTRRIPHFSTREVTYLPDYMAQINPVLLTFDIETYSDNPDVFPNKDNIKHEIFMISIIVERIGIPESRKRYLISTLKSDKLDNATYIEAEDERDLIMKFNDVVAKVNPIIITGYNINNFDFDYIKSRSFLHNIEFPDIRFSKLIDVEPRDYKLKNNGELKYDFPGIIDLDMYPLMKNLYSTLNSYKLDYIAKEFLNASKHPITHVQMFEGFEKSISATEENADEIAKEIAIIGNYCLQDSQLIGQLIAKLNIWQVLDEFSRILGVTMKDVFSRGQQVRGVSQIYDVATRRNYVIYKPSNANIDNSKYGGGYNIEPLKGIHDNVMCFDFKSLYPSIMIAYNICYSTYISTTKSSDYKNNTRIDKVGRENCNYIDTEGGTHWFIKPEIYKGILPTLMKNLIDERNKVRNIMKDKTLSEFHIAALDKRQWALKISANAMYGMLGVEFSKGMLPFRQGAQSITAYGRNLLAKAVDIAVNKEGFKLIYGDTDSIMVQHPSVNNGSEGIKKGKELENTLNKHFIKPLEMELEKVGRILCITKKKYCYKICNDSGDFVDTMYKGIASVRRDTIKWLGILYQEVLDMYMDGATSEMILNLFLERTIELLSNKVPYELLIKPMKISNNYKSESAPGNVFYRYLYSIGRSPQIGERVDALYIHVDEKLPISYYLRPYDLVKDNPDDFRLNYQVYLNNASKSLDILFNVVSSDDIERLICDVYENTKIKLDSKKLSKPFNTIAKYVEHNYTNFDFNDIESYINIYIFH